MKNQDQERKNKIKACLGIKLFASDIAERFPDGGVNVADELPSVMESFGYDDELVDRFSTDWWFIDIVTDVVSKIYDGKIKPLS